MAIIVYLGSVGRFNRNVKEEQKKNVQQKTVKQLTFPLPISVNINTIS